MLDVVEDDIEKATCGKITTFYQVKHHVKAHLSILATLNLVKSCFKSFKGQLWNTEFSISVGTLIDK